MSKRDDDTGGGAAAGGAVRRAESDESAADVGVVIAGDAVEDVAEEEEELFRTADLSRAAFSFFSSFRFSRLSRSRSLSFSLSFGGVGVGVGGVVVGVATLGMGASGVWKRCGKSDPDEAGVTGREVGGRVVEDAGGVGNPGCGAARPVATAYLSSCALYSASASYL